VEVRGEGEGMERPGLRPG